MGINDDNPQVKVKCLEFNDTGNSNTPFIRHYVFDESGDFLKSFDLDYSGADYTAIGPVVRGGIDASALSHGDLANLNNDDHPQYLNEARHDALPQDNPHNVTAIQVGAETSAQLDARDTANRDRSNHTGTQLASTISDFAQAVRNTILTGINTVVSTANTAAITAADTVLSSIGKLQARTALLFYAESATNAAGLIVENTTETDYLILDANVPVDGNYRIDASWSWSANDAAQDCIVRLYSGATLLWQQQQEPKDAAGTGVVLPLNTGGTINSGTNQRHLVHVHDVVTLSAGTNQIRLTLDASATFDDAAIYKAVVSIQKWGLN